MLPPPMARPLRLDLAGGLYHVTSRGGRREAIYIDEEDREKWLEILEFFLWVSWIIFWLEYIATTHLKHDGFLAIGLMKQKLRLVQKRHYALPLLQCSF